MFQRNRTCVILVLQSIFAGFLKPYLKSQEALFLLHKCYNISIETAISTEIFYKYRKLRKSNFRVVMIAQLRLLCTIHQHGGAHKRIEECGANALGLPHLVAL